MGILEAISIAENMAWGRKKYHKAVKDTYTHVILLSNYKFLISSIIIAGLAYTLIEPQATIDALVNFHYADNPHQLTPVTTYDFIEKRSYRYVSILWILLQLEIILRYMSLLAGGYTIPKKP